MVGKKSIVFESKCFCLKKKSIFDQNIHQMMLNRAEQYLKETSSFSTCTKLFAFYVEVVLFLASSLQLRDLCFVLLRIRWKALQVLTLRQGFQPEGGAADSHGETHWRETSPLHVLPCFFLPEGEPALPRSESSLWGKSTSLQVWKWNTRTLLFTTSNIV